MIDPEGLAASVTAAAIAISKSLNDDDLNLYGAVFTQLGDTLATIAQARAVKSAAENDNERSPAGA